MDAKVISRYSKKTVPQLIKIATTHFNKFIRERDLNGENFKCISCQRTLHKDNMNAGHFYSAGQFPEARFDEDNVHGQCVRCNKYLHGNLAYYKDNLLSKIGKIRMQKLQQKVYVTRRNGFKWDRFYIIEVIEKYKNLNK